MEHTITAKCYAMQNTNEIIAQYEIIKENNILRVDANEKLDLLWAEIDKMREIEEKVNEVNLLKNDILKYGKISRTAYNEILRAKIFIEQLKIPTFVEHANKFLSAGKSVVIYVNLIESINILAKELKTDCVLHGKKTSSITDFQSDKSRIIICSIHFANAGGFMLNDTNGNFPRVAIMSGIVSNQVLGRIHRANNKTGTEQLIMFCEETVEEKMCEKMQKRLDNYYTFFTYKYNS